MLTGDELQQWNMICDSAPALIRPGGIDPAGIELMFKIYRIDNNLQPEIFEKIMAFFAEARQAAKEEK